MSWAKFPELTRLTFRTDSGSETAKPYPVAMNSEALMNPAASEKHYWNKEHKARNPNGMSHADVTIVNNAKKLIQQRLEAAEQALSAVDLTANEFCRKISDEGNWLLPANESSAKKLLRAYQTELEGLKERLASKHPNAEPAARIAFIEILQDYPQVRSVLYEMGTQCGDAQIAY